MAGDSPTESDEKQYGESLRLDQLHPYIWMKYILPKCSVQEHKSLSMVNSAVRNIVTNYNANQVIGGPGLEKAEKGEESLRLDQLHPFIWKTYILPKCSVQDHKSLRMVNSTVCSIVANYEADLKQPLYGGSVMKKTRQREEGSKRLDELHPHIWKNILQKCSLQDKKNLRLVNSTLYSLVTDNDPALKKVFIRDPITPVQLLQLSKDIPEIISLEFTLTSLSEQEDLGEDDLDKIWYFLRNKHPSLRIDITVQENITRWQLFRLACDVDCLVGLECSYSFDINSDDDTYSKAMYHLVTRHPLLRRVKISNAHGSFLLNGIDDLGMLFLCQLKHLQDLTLWGATLTGEYLKTKGQCWKEMKNLRLFNCMNLSEEGLNCLLKMCGSGPENLLLSNATCNTTGEELTAVCPNLRRLSICGQNQLTQAGISNLLTHCAPGLRELGLPYPLNSERYCRKLLKAYPRLKFINSSLKHHEELVHYEEIVLR